MTFLAKLDSLMEGKGLNKNRLAEESGIPYTTIDGFYKKGYDNAKLSTLRKLSDYFGVTLDYLIDDSADSPQYKALNFPAGLTTVQKLQMIADDELGRPATEEEMKILRVSVEGILERLSDKQ